MNKQEQFINLEDQSKEGVKAFGCLLATIVICSIGVSLIIRYKYEIDAAIEVFTNYLNSL